MVRSPHLVSLFAHDAEISDTAILAAEELFTFPQLRSFGPLCTVEQAALKLDAAHSDNGQIVSLRLAINPPPIGTGGNGDQGEQHQAHGQEPTP